MNGLEKDTWLKLFAPDDDSQRAGSAIYDIFQDFHDVIVEQPKICGKKFITRFHASLALAVLAGAFIVADWKAGWVIFRMILR